MYTSLSNRRSFIKKMAILSAMTAAASMFPGIVFAEEQLKDLPSGDLDWKKGPCRFCGVGCGILVGVENGKAVAVKGDPNSSVNKGLLCVKGYHQIMCIAASDRLTHALVKKNGTYVKTPISDALDLVCMDMAKKIVLDGEGATKFIEINIKGAKTDKQAKEIALAVANSNLVKTAAFGENPNWGRIAAAVGSLGIKDIFDENLKIDFGSFSKKEIIINVTLLIGKGKATAYTSDLSYEYVRINAAYN